MANIILLVQWTAAATFVVLLAIGFFATARVKSHVRPATTTLANRLTKQLPPDGVQFPRAESINNVAWQVTVDPQTGEVVATRGAASKRLPPHEAKPLSKLLRSL